MAFRPSAAPKVAVEERGGSDVDGLEEGAGGAFFDHESDGESGGEDDQQEGGRGREDEAQVCEFVPAKDGQGGGLFFLSWNVRWLA